MIINGSKDMVVQKGGSFFVGSDPKAQDGGSITPALYGPYYLRTTLDENIEYLGQKLTSYDQTVDGQSTECSRMTIDGRELAQNITYCEGEGGHMIWGSEKRYDMSSLKE